LLLTVNNDAKGARIVATEQDGDLFGAFRRLA
jgi:hypothetical protein